MILGMNTAANASTDLDPAPAAAREDALAAARSYATQLKALQADPETSINLVSLREVVELELLMDLHTRWARNGLADAIRIAARVVSEVSNHTDDFARARTAHRGRTAHAWLSDHRLQITAAVQTADADEQASLVAALIGTRA